MAKAVTFNCARCGREKTTTNPRSKAYQGKPRYCGSKCATDRHPPAEVRFFDKVEKQANGCWYWTGNRNNWGYGFIWINGGDITAHRFAYENWVGPIPSDKIVMHTCDVTRCVNPRHLRLGTLSDNSQDCLHKNRKKTAKLTVEAVKEIRQRTAEMGLNANTYRELAAKYGVKDCAIYLVATGRTWKWVA